MDPVNCHGQMLQCPFCSMQMWVSLHLPHLEECLGSLNGTQGLGNKVLQKNLIHRSKMIKKILEAVFLDFDYSITFLVGGLFHWFKWS